MKLLQIKTEQNSLKQNLFNYLFIITSVTVFVITLIRCITVPFTGDEISTFFYFIQSGKFLPYSSHVDTNNHILNSCLSWVCFHLFGASPFSLRLPNLLALLVLICAVYRISKQLIHIHSRLVLVAGFLISFHWLSFYSLCRGYGISMAFLVLSIFNLIEYFKTNQYKNLLLFCLCTQIAVSANLILVIIVVIFTFSIIVFQFLNRKLFRVENIIVLFIHITLLVSWIKFSFFLQSNFLHPNQNIFAGASNGYWNVTFVSLIDLLTGITNRWVPIFILCTFLALMVIVAVQNFKKVTSNIQNVFSPSLFYALLFVAAVLTFYTMQKLFNVSYPENRMGLFFYVFFVITLVYTFDQFRGITVEILSGFIFLIMLIHFSVNINFRKHSYRFYDVIPEQFFTRLLKEQKLNPEKITISGQPDAEILYDFWNYLYKGALNNGNNSSYVMQMNCDYVVVLKKNEKFYKPYYNKIDADKDSSVILLKRKEKLKRDLLISVDSLKTLQGNNEYYNLYLIKDTCYKSTNPLLVEFNISSIQAEMPINMWLVFEIDSSEGHPISYQKIPLDWILYNWTFAKDQILDLVSGPLPLKIHRMVCYIWNIEKKEVKINVNSVKIYQLEGMGVCDTISEHKVVAP